MMWFYHLSCAAIIFVSFRSFYVLKVAMLHIHWIDRQKTMNCADLCRSKRELDHSID